MLNEKCKYLFLLGLFFDLFIVSPVVSSDIVDVSGIVSHGQSIVISGEGFGGKSPAAPLLWETFEYGVDGNSVSTSPDWSAYGVDGGYISTTTAFSGTRSAHNEITSSNGAGFNTSYFTFPSTGKLYYTYMSKFVSTGDSYGQFKNGRIGTTSDHYSGAGVAMISDGYVARYTDDGTFVAFTSPDEASGNSQYLPNMRSSAWNRHELYREAGSSGATMWFASGTTERIYHNLSDVETLSSSVILGLMYANPHNDGDHKIYVDDVYVDNTQARVELCEGSTWASRGHCYPQIPSAWSDSSVTVTINTASFNTNDTSYFYVVDSNGIASHGYPVTIGEMVESIPIVETATKLRIITN